MPLVQKRQMVRRKRNKAKAGALKAPSIDLSATRGKRVPDEMPPI